MKRIRVVFIADIGIAGGATKSLVELVTTLREEQNVEPIVFTANNTIINSKLNEVSIENYALGYGAFLQNSPEDFWKKPIKWIIRYIEYIVHFYPSLRKALNCIDWNTIDIVHTNVARNDIGMEVCRRTGILCVCHLREYGELDFKCWTYRKNYVSYLAKNTDAFIAVSESVRRYWMKKGIPEDKISVIYNGVNCSSIITASHNGWKTDKILRVVIVGGFIRAKGQYQAVEAVCCLPEEIRRKVKLDIIGGISKSGCVRIKRLFSKAGIENNIEFVGQCDDVCQRLQRYHIGLMCSKMEAFGRVTVEYMHAGLAVIATESGANSELIKNGDNGLLYDKNSTSELTAAITRLYYDRELMIRLAENGYNTAKKRFTNRLNAERIRKKYNILLEGKKGRE